jgi:anti-sigma factor RsiW
VDCSEIRPNLLAYLDGEVTDAERAQIEAHLATCQACADELARLQALQADLRDAIPAGLAHLRLSHPAEERIRARLLREQERRGFLDVLAGLWRPRPRLIKAAIPLVVAFFLAFAGFVGTLPVSVSAQETIILGPTTFAPDTDAALRVIVRDYASAHPISDAEITVRLRPQGEDEAVLLYTGHTGRQGTADVRFRVPPYAQDQLSADLIVTTASSLGQAEVAQPVTVRRSFRIYLTSDKPLYQPGQAIHLRALALEAATSLPAADRQVTFVVKDPNDKSIFEETLRASNYGISAVDYTLPADTLHGDYRLSAMLGDTVSQRTVAVGRYERPRFKVDLIPARSYYVPGETVEGQVTAHYFHEEPLPGATVTLRAYLHDPERRLLATVQGRTGEQGKSDFSFGLPSELRTEQANLALEASVADEMGHVEWAGRVLPVAAEPLVIDVVAEGGRLRPGVENTVYVLSATPDGAPAPAQLTINVTGQQRELATDDYGLAEFRFVPGAGVRNVQVEVAARDARGREVSRAIILSADQGPAQVLLRLDRAAYEVGETMHLEVLAGQGDVVYVDVVHQGQTLSTHVAELHAGSAELALDVSPEMAGTLELHAYQVLPDGTLARDTRLAIVDAPVQVTVDVRSDETTYQPGDVARVTIDTHLDGTPVQSAVGLAVVDESVFALEDRAPGFAKLFFLLEASLLDPAARPLGMTLLDVLDPPDGAEVRAAQDLAARAAWANLPSGDLVVRRSSRAEAVATIESRARGRFRGLGLGLGVALLGIPLVLWVVVVSRLRHTGSLRPTLWRTALVLIGLAFVLVVPAIAVVLLGLFSLLGKTLLLVLLVAWLAALVALGLHAWRRRDDGAQIVTLLVAAYSVLGVLMGYVAEQDGDPGFGLVLGMAVTFLSLLAALLLLAAGFWQEEQRIAASMTIVLALLSVALVVLAGAALSASSLFGRTLTDPRLYAGPVGWLSGCARPIPEVVEKVVTQVVKETVRITDTPQAVEKEVVKEVEKEVTQVVEKIVTATSEPQPSVLPTATPEPQPTVLPTTMPTASPTPTSKAPPPLLGQFVPETIYWMPQALTNESGHLEIEIPLPDAPATWRLTALASTRHGQLGAVTAVLHVK